MADSADIAYENEQFSMSIRLKNRIRNRLLKRDSAITAENLLRQDCFVMVTVGKIMRNVNDLENKY